MAHLSSGHLDIGAIRRTARSDIVDCLDKCVGSKIVVWDESLTGPFGIIAEYSLLKDHGVEKMVPLRPGRLPATAVHNVVFITRPNASLMKNVAENVLSEEQQGGPKKEFHIFFLPRRSLLCEKKLKEHGVYGSFSNVDEYNLEIFPFDSDVLSIENDMAFRECYLENDYTSMYSVAKALMLIQSIYGIIPSINGKGVMARHVTNIMLRMRRELAGSEPHIATQIDQLLLIDRNVDPITPLLTQLTYEGLIDEIFGIHNSSVKFPGEKFNKASSNSNSSPNEPKKLVLNSGELLFAALRDKNFNSVGPALSQNARLITEQFDERHSAKTVGEMKAFVSKLPHMQAAKTSLSNHTSIAELLKEEIDKDDFLETLRVQQAFINGQDTDKVHPYIEDCIAKDAQLLKCICNNGFKAKTLEFYKRELLLSYGFEHAITLANLERCGLLYVQNQYSKAYLTVRKTLKLIVQDVDEQNPMDPSYVYSGYAPLSVRLAQYLQRPGWRSITEILTQLPGDTVEEVQQLPQGLRQRRSSVTSSSSSTGGQKVVLVFFLGGVTQAEIAALRFLAHQEDSPAEYIVGTTKIITGDNWLTSLQDTLRTQAPMNPFD